MTTLIICAAKRGVINQCRTVAQVLGWQVDREIHVPGAGRQSPLVEQLMSWAAAKATAFGESYNLRGIGAPVRVIASGASSRPLVAHLRERLGSGMRAVYIGSPRGAARIYDVAIASRHALDPGSSPRDYESARQTVWITGVPVSSVPSDPEPGHGVVLIGGTNKAFQFDGPALAAEIRAWARTLDRLTVVFSRRTPGELEAGLRAELSLPAVNFIGRNDSSGARSAMAQAAAIAVTPDSITMICEAHQTGVPVKILESVTVTDRRTSTYRFFEDVRAEAAPRFGLPAELWEDLRRSLSAAFP